MKCEGRYLTQKLLEQKNGLWVSARVWYDNKMSKGQNTTAKGVRLRDEVWEWLGIEANRRKLTVNELINEYLGWYKKKVEEKRLQSSR